MFSLEESSNAKRSQMSLRELLSAMLWLPGSTTHLCEGGIEGHKCLVEMSSIIQENRRIAPKTMACNGRLKKWEGC